MRTALATAALLAAAGFGRAQVVQERVVGSVLRPDKTEPTAERVASLKLAPGFKIEKFAEGLGNPRIMVVGGDGSVYVSRRHEGDVLRLKDTDGDGRADLKDTLCRIPMAHGLAIHGNKLYIAAVKEVFVADLEPDGAIGEPRAIITDLPEGGQHPNRTLFFAPPNAQGADSGDHLFITVGSTCNACDEPNPECATILRANADGSSRTIFAKGLRNTIGMAWHPKTGELWAMDHGIDWLGDDAQQEELNKIEGGKDYGWPFFYEDTRPNNAVALPPGKTHDDLRPGKTGSVTGYDAHAAPMQMVFYAADAFPAEYRNDSFVTFRGSWNRADPSGYEVVRVRFSDDGRPEGFEPFVTGFLTEGGTEHFGRPVGLAVAKDGSLLFTDDTCGVIYRVSAAASTAP